MSEHSTSLNASQQQSAKTLAAAFAAHIRANLTAEQLAEVVRLNATPEYSGCCATHNYFDANDCLDFAWQEVFGREMDLQSDADMAIANRAWDLAKAAGFAASKTEAK